MRLVKNQPPPTYTLELSAEELRLIKAALVNTFGNNSGLYVAIKNASE